MNTKRNEMKCKKKREKNGFAVKHYANCELKCRFIFDLIYMEMLNSDGSKKKIVKPPIAYCMCISNENFCVFFSLHTFVVIGTILFAWLCCYIALNAGNT